MTETRYRDRNWPISTNPNGNVPFEDVKLAVLMDIRDELKTVTHQLRTLNRVFECPNFIAVPSYLRTIMRQTRKPVRRTRKATK